MNYDNSPLFSRLLSQSPLSRRELILLLHTAPSRYKEHSIKKRNGRGLRLICQPTAELKFFQKLLVTNELNNLPIHSSATAYRAGISIKQHALPHASSKYLLKLDFENFFPSLDAQAIRHVLDMHGNYTDAEVEIICQLLCMRRTSESLLRLSIGAPSSPFISNALMYEFDATAANYCLKNNIVYTRYADDIALSTSIPRSLDSAHEFFKALPNTIEYLNLIYNSSKTVNVSRKRRRTLTGLTLSNSGNASIGRNQKRVLRAAVHALMAYKVQTMPPSRLRGMLAFVFSLDPQWVTSLCLRYGASSINEIAFRQNDNDNPKTNEPH